METTLQGRFVLSSKSENQNAKMGLRLSGRVRGLPGPSRSSQGCARGGGSTHLAAAFPYGTLLSRTPSALPPLGGTDCSPVQTPPIPRIREKVYIKILTAIRSGAGAAALSLGSKQLSSPLSAGPCGCQENVGQILPADTQVHQGPSQRGPGSSEPP